MWFWLLLLSAAVTTSEFLLRLPWLAQVSLMRGTARKAMRVLRSSRISDHWKERALPAYAWSMARASVTFFALLCLALLPLLAFGLIAPGGLSAWVAALMQPLSILALCAASLCWVTWRWKTGGAVRTSDAYSPLDKVLHRLALASPAIAGMTHDIERGVFLRSAPEPQGGPVIITGLARGGTTILMRELHGTGQFGSLTYADMPFVLAPNLWAGLSGRGQTPGTRRERAHGDGIEVDTQSPEALDEVYWRIFDGESYIRPAGLGPHAPDESLIEGYRDLMRLVLRRTGKRRYLSKNNNMILRLQTVAAALPEARFLIPLRDPLRHANSLLMQHRRFRAAPAFTQDYMTWLGHHEFGATHRPFLLEDDHEGPQGDPDAVDYWLRVWIAVHRHVEGILDGMENVIVVPHDRSVRDPAVWRRLAAELSIDAGPSQEIRAPAPRQPEAYNPTLATEACRIHDRLQNRAELRLGLAPTRQGGVASGAG